MLQREEAWGSWVKKVDCHSQWVQGYPMQICVWVFLFTDIGILTSTKYKNLSI
jgi:hypothetical protein